MPGVRVMAFPPGQQVNWQYVVLQIDRAAAGLDRDTLMAALHAERVMARRYFYPGCHLMAPYRTMFPDVGARLPVTAELTRSILVCRPAPRLTRTRSRAWRPSSAWPWRMRRK